MRHDWSKMQQNEANAIVYYASLGNLLAMRRLWDMFYPTGHSHAGCAKKSAIFVGYSQIRWHHWYLRTRGWLELKTKYWKFFYKHCLHNFENIMVFCAINQKFSISQVFYVYLILPTVSPTMEQTISWKTFCVVMIYFSGQDWQATALFTRPPREMH